LSLVFIDQPLSSLMRGYNGLLDSLLTSLRFDRIVNPANDEILFSGWK